MNELVINLHIHTPYSDGHKTHRNIARDAVDADLDAILITDHNIFVKDLEGYYQENNKKVLLLVGEEIHDQSLQPQKNHLLAFGIKRDLAKYANDTQNLVNIIKNEGGISFIAHPVDPAAPSVDEPDISWTDWQIDGFTGIELWNGFSEFKSLLKSKLHAIYYAYNPNRIAHGPHKVAIKKWDELISNGRRVVAVGGSDAHALPARMGPLKQTVFPYTYHFKSINTHLLCPQDLSGDVAIDRELVLTALASGSAFIGYDLPASTKGFRFSAQGFGKTTGMGATISSKHGITFQIRLPQPAECHLIKDGKSLKMWQNQSACTFITSEPGTYRVEAYINYLGSRRNWILSNPIYLI